MSVEVRRGSASLHLESFIWLLIWAIVYAFKDIEGAKAANQET